jgi:ABC-2 type transport system permease protein
MDLNAMPLAVRTGQMGNQPQINFLPWYYFPVITPLSQHPIVRNLNSIKTQFVSSLDTVRARNVRKSVLLWSSPYSRTVSVPSVVSLAITRQQPDESLYAGPPRIIAVLLEGRFESTFRNRIPPALMDAKEIGFREFSEPARMIVVSDGDIVRNQFHIPDGYPLPLGYDQFTRETFGNKDFILNAMSYLTEGPGMISIRSRDLKLRLLDKAKINNQKITWQLINLFLPVGLIALLGVLLIGYRKRKFSR